MLPEVIPGGGSPSRGHKWRPSSSPGEGSRPGYSQAIRPGWLQLSPTPGVPPPPSEWPLLLGDTVQNSAGLCKPGVAPGPEAAARSPIL